MPQLRHVLGIAFNRSDKAFATGDLPQTQFSFDGNTGRAEDFNNYHFGVIAKAFGEFSETFLLRTAGGIEMAKIKKSSSWINARVRWSRQVGDLC